MARYRKILCPVDFSDLSRAALEAAIDLAAEARGSLTIVHVYQLPSLPPEAMILPDTVDAIVAATDKQLAALKNELEGRGVPIETVSVPGAPWDAIVTLAGTKGHDLIVLGTHGRTGIKHALLGSVAERVVRHAPCSVLVVR